jgi:bifunctional ADP-heptose synthase (sugar kinase/adenylyltransferase)
MKNHCSPMPLPFRRDVIGAEMDNQSDASIANLVIKLCDQMQSIFVFIQAQPEQPLGAALKVLNHLMRSKNKIYAVAFVGSNEQAERLMNTLQEKFIREDSADKIKDRIKEFALT